MPSSARYRSLPFALILSFLISGGCGKLPTSLVEISRLRAEIVKEYGEKEVNVNLHNSRSLSVTFINSPLNTKSPEQRAKRAQQTAGFVNRRYSSINQIESIWVYFVRTQTRYIFVHYSEGLGEFGFDKNGRPLNYQEGLPAGNSETSLIPMATYSPKLKQTEVMITRLQLEGDLDNGLALAPHFTVPGDATGVKRSSSFPQSVTFDFASYSEKSMFPGETRITVLADGKAVFETSEQFSTSQLPNFRFTAFLKLEVPYPAFHRMTLGKKLTLRLGDRDYQLTAEQLQALREMTAYVRD